MLEPVLKNPWVRALGLFVLLILTLFVMYLLGQVLVPLFFAFIVAYILDPLVDKIQARKVPRMAAAVLLLGGLLLVIVCTPLVVIPNTISEAQRLIDQASKDVGDEWLDALLDKLPLERVVRYLGWYPETAAVEPQEWARPNVAQVVWGEERHVTGFERIDASIVSTAVLLPVGAPPPMPADDLDERAIITRRIGELIRDNADEFVRSHSALLARAGGQAGTTAASIFGAVGNFLVSFVVFIGNLVLFVFVALYLLRDYDRIVLSIDGLVPPRFRGRVRDVMHKIDLQLRSFLRGQLLVMCSLGIMYGIGLTLSGVPLGLTLALLGGAASFVPYLGAALTIIPSILLTLLAYGFDWHVVGAIATFAIAQFMEGNVLTPRIVGSQVGLGPVWVILAVMVFGGAFGFPGLIIAVPLAAVLKVLVQEALAYYRASRLFAGGSSDPPLS